MQQPFRLALIAHDQKKDDMVAFARAYESLLAPCTIVATGTTGGLMRGVACRMTPPPRTAGRVCWSATSRSRAAARC